MIVSPLDYPFFRPVDPNDEGAGQVCPETARYLALCRRSRLDHEPSEIIMLWMDAAIGHQIICRHYGYGLSDYAAALEQVRELAYNMGCPFPYVVESGVLYSVAPL